MLENIKTIKDMVDHSVERYRHGIALQIKRNNVYQKYTYEECGQLIKNLEAGLISIGVKPEDKIAVLSENRPEWTLSYLSITSMGNIVVPVDSLLTITEIRHILVQSEAKYLICSQKFLDDVLEIMPTIENLEYIISMENQTLSNALTFKEVLNMGKTFISKNSEKVFDDYIPEENDVASLLFTSGTTGQSKGVLLTHKNLISDIKGVQNVVPVDVTDTFLSVLPLHHTYECTGGMLFPFQKGATVTFAGSLKPTVIINAIKETNVTIMLGVPALFDAMLRGIMRRVEKSPTLTKYLFKSMFNTVKFVKQYMNKDIAKTTFKTLREKAGLNSLRYFIAGGAALSPEVQEAFSYLGFVILQGYGLTETSPVVAVNLSSNNKVGSVGPALHDVDIAIDTPGENGVGEIKIRGPVVMKGYYKNKEATDKVIKNGWFFTGDLGYIDDDGFVFIVGRSKNVIVSRAGKNIYPEEIENILHQSDFVKEVLVIGEIVDDSNREEVHAIIVPAYENIDVYAEENELNLSEKDIENLIGKEIQRLCETIAPYKRVKTFSIREEEFPKTSTRKIKRYLFMKKNLRIGNNKS